MAQGERVGSLSLWRRAQLMHTRSDLEVDEFRGIVPKRLKKLADGVASCTFLGIAGTNRLNMMHIVTVAIESEGMLPAVVQGVIASNVDLMSRPQLRY
jgi:hydroxymethylbilane synthase